MPYRYLGTTGLKVSILSYGTWLLDYSHKCNDSWVECAKALFKAGVNYFDSAEFYGFGAGDRMLGRAIKEIGCERKDLVISVKIIAMRLDLIDLECRESILPYSTLSCPPKRPTFSKIREGD